MNAERLNQSAKDTMTSGIVKSITKVTKYEDMTLSPKLLRELQESTPIQIE